MWPRASNVPHTDRIRNNVVTPSFTCRLLTRKGYNCSLRWVQASATSILHNKRIAAYVAIHVFLGQHACSVPAPQHWTRALHSFGGQCFVSTATALLITRKNAAVA